MLQDAFNRALYRDRELIEYVRNEIFRAGYDGDPRYTARSRGPVFQNDDATLALIEEWIYPSMDLLRWKDRQYPYDTREAPRDIRDPNNGTTPYNIWNWQGRLLAHISARRHDLHVVLHYNFLPWNRPRDMQKHLGRYAAFLRDEHGERGLRPRRIEQEFLRELQEVDPETGERTWYTFVTSDIPIENLHTQLVIFAWRQAFPVPSDDEDRARQFVQNCVKRRTDNGSHKDAGLVSDCVVNLIKRFDLPSSPLALPRYIAAMVRGMTADKKRERTYESSQRISSSDCTVPEARQHIWVEMRGQFEPYFWDILWVPSESTLYEWIKAKKIQARKELDGTVIIPEEGLQTAVAMAQRRNERKCAIAWGEALGFARERLEQIIHRTRKPDGTPDWALIDKKIDAAKRGRTRARKRDTKVPKGER